MATENYALIVHVVAKAMKAKPRAWPQEGSQLGSSTRTVVPQIFVAARFQFQLLIHCQDWMKTKMFGFSEFSVRRNAGDDHI
jgi:hypothetical protein